MNINELLNNLTPEDRNKINNFINSTQAKNIEKKLSDSDKNKLLEQFSRLDPQLIRSKLNGLTKDDILKFLK